MNRRRLLATVATSAVAFAGCTSSSGEDTRVVSTDSEIRKQPTADHPPEIKFSLTNESDDPITVSANASKPFVSFSRFRLTGDTGSLVLFPVSDLHHHADVASTRTNGCWRFVDTDGNETYIVANSVEDRLTLGPGLTHHVTQRLYYEGEENDCFPDDNYTADHTLEFQNREITITFTVQVTFSDGRLSGVEVQQ